MSKSSSSSDGEDGLTIGERREALTVGAARKNRQASSGRGSIMRPNQRRHQSRNSSISSCGAETVGDAAGGSAADAAAAVGSSERNSGCHADRCNSSRGTSSSRSSGDNNSVDKEQRNKQRARTVTHQPKSSNVKSKANTAREGVRKAKAKGKGKAVDRSRSKIDQISKGKKRSSSSKGSTNKTTKSSKKKKMKLGILGLPMHDFWDSEDCDYDDSDDGSYAPPPTSNSSPPSGGEGVGTRSSKSRRRDDDGGKGGLKKRKSGDRGDGGGNEERDWIGRVSSEVLLNGLIRPYLGSLSKCALQRTCRQMRGLLSDTRAWRSLDLRAEVIGTRTMRSGRQSHLSHQPLFFLARSVVVQPRFALVNTVDLRRMNLGAMGSSPDLLLQLFQHCRHITTLNLWGTYLEHERLPQPDCAVERVIAEHLPGVQHLALDMDASNKGLRVLLEGCRRLKSLHIGSRSNLRGDSASMYPNDLGMKAFSLVGAPCLQALSLFDKVNIGAAGLRCVLDSSACPELKTLVLARMDRINDQSMKAIVPSMAMVTDLTLHQCPVKVSTLQHVVERCPELRTLLVTADRVVWHSVNDGKPLWESLHTCTTSKLELFMLELTRLCPSCLRIPLWWKDLGTITDDRRRSANAAAGVDVEETRLPRVAMRQRPSDDYSRICHYMQACS